MDVLKDLGLDPKQVADLLVEKVCFRILHEEDVDEDGPVIAETKWAREVRERCANVVDATIADHMESVLKPKLEGLLENLVIQKTNDYGERKGDPMTLTEAAVLRAETYLTEQVNLDGKTRSADGYNWRAYSTRIEWMVNQWLRSHIEAEIKKVLSDANTKVANGLASAVQQAVRQVANGMKVNVKVEA